MDEMGDIGLNRQRTNLNIDNSPSARNFKNALLPLFWIIKNTNRILGEAILTRN